MAAALALDQRTTRALERGLAPHKSVIDPNRPRTLTGMASYPKPVAATLAHWSMGLDRQPINKIIGYE